ncbi:unnamed protein product [Cylicocyclus nassatus]|uniref:Uncharacterized protein n=1 Tax=Cylicocyclus nassatus TaxID=53992 RepID=A0AA36GRY5_CYLNA|nr:unnamed protein product [Cylicocyclus nassatus]
MAAHLITDKRLLTHYCNKLDTIISRFKGEELETLNVAAAQGESASHYTRESLQRLSEAIGALDTVTHNIKQTMTEYATKFTELDYPTEKDKQDFEEYSAKAEKALISATDYLLVLKARVHAFIVVKAQPEHNQHSGSVQDGRILPKQRRLGCAILIAATHMAANKAHCSLDPPFRQECRRPGKCQQPVTHITIYATFRTE